MKVQQKILIKVGNFVVKYYILILIVGFIMTGAGVYFFQNLGLKTDYMELMPEDIPSVKNIREVSKNMGGLGFVYFVLYYDNEAVKNSLKVQNIFQKELEQRLKDYDRKAKNESLSSKEIKDGKKKIEDDFNNVFSFKDKNNKLVTIPAINKKEILKLANDKKWSVTDSNIIDEIDKAVVIMKSEADREYEAKRGNKNESADKEKAEDKNQDKDNKGKNTKVKDDNKAKQNNTQNSNQNNQEKDKYYPQSEVTKAKIILREIDKASLIVKNKSKYSEKEYHNAFYITNIINNIPVCNINRIKLKPEEEKELGKSEIDNVDLSTFKDKINLKQSDLEKFYFTDKDKEDLEKFNYSKLNFTQLKRLNEILTSKWGQNSKRLTDRLVVELKKFVGKEYNRERNELIRYIDYKIDYKFLKDNALLMMDTEDVEKIMSLTNKGQLDDEYSTFEEIYSRYASSDFLGDKEYMLDKDKKILLFFIKPLSNTTDTANTQYLMEQLDKLKYTINKDIKQLDKELAYMKSEEIEKVDIAKVNENIKNYYPEILIEHSGGYKLALDQMNTVQDDLVLTSIVAIIWIALALIIFTRRVTYMLYIMLSLAIGMILTFGFAYIAIGYLNIITGFLLAVLTGLGVDFGVHFVARFREERHLGKDKKEAIRIVYKTTGMGSFTSLVTTAGGFFALCISSFKGFSQYGLVAGFGLTLTALSMYFITAVMLLIFVREKKSKKVLTGNDLVAHEEKIKDFYDPNKKYKFAKPILAIGIILTIVFGILGAFVEFEWNSKKLEKWGQVSIRVEEDVQREFNVSPDPAIFTTYSYDINKNDDPIVRLYNIFHCDTKLAKRRLNEAQDKFNDAEMKFETTDETYIEAKNRLTKAKADYDYALKVTRKYKFKKKYEINDVDLTQLSSEEQDKLKKAQKDFDKAQEEFSENDHQYINAKKHLEKTIVDIVGFPKVDKILSICDVIKPLEQQKANLKIIEKNRDIFITNIEDELAKPDNDKDTKEGLKEFKTILQNTTKPLTIEDLPEILKIRFLGKDPSKRDNFFTYVYPYATLWDGRIMKEYVLQISQIEVGNGDGHTLFPTGVHSLYKDVMYLILDEGAFILPIVLLVVFLLLIFDFRKVKPAILSFVPLLCGLIWTLGLVKLFGIKFNYMNLLVMALVIGMGIDNCVHIYHRYHQTNSVYVAVMKTGAASIICSVTTILGWCALLLANYRGLNSMGIVAAIGMAACLVTSLTIEPALLQILKDREEKKHIKIDEKTIKETEEGYY